MTTLDRTTKTIGQLLVDKEKVVDLTRGEIADRLGISRQTYIQWKRGQLMGEEYVEVLADYLEIATVDILMARYSTFCANPRYVKPAHNRAVQTMLALQKAA